MYPLSPYSDCCRCSALLPFSSSSVYVSLLICFLMLHGQVQYMFLTHADDVADHAKWAREMGLKRVIHETEADPALAITERSGRGLDECEIKLRGGNGDEGMPALRSWDPFEGALGEETRVIFQPGHTKGQCALHFQPDASGPAAAFTGDHLGWLRQTESLDAFTAFCKDSHRVQVRISHH